KVICPGGKMDERVLSALIACTRRGKFVVCIAKREPSIADYGLGLVGHGAAQPAPDIRGPGATCKLQYDQNSQQVDEERVITSALSHMLSLLAPQTNASPSSS